MAEVEETVVDVHPDVQDQAAKEDIDEDEQLMDAEESRRRRERRAERFGVPLKEDAPANPPKDLDAPRPFIVRERHEGFVTGVDMYSEEERKKAEARAKKFGLVKTEEQLAAEKAEREAREKEREEALAKRKKRMERFGMETDAMEETPKEDDKEITPHDIKGRDPPREIASPDQEELRLDTVHVYGTDELSTKDVFRIFADYGPSHVEWINDSACNVVFLDEFSVKRVLYGPLVQRHLADPELHPTVFRRGPMAKRRYPVFLRVATAVDVKPAKPKPSRWSRYNNLSAKQRLQDDRPSIRDRLSGQDDRSRSTLKKRGRGHRDDMDIENEDQIGEGESRKKTRTDADGDVAVEDGNDKQEPQSGADMVDA